MNAGHMHQGRVLCPFVLSLFCFNAPCKFTPITNLCPLILSLMLFGWFISISLNLFCGHIIFDLCPLFHEHNLGVKQGLGVKHSIPFSDKSVSLLNQGK
jgi:hypothetical protein